MENAYNSHILNASFPANLTSFPRDAKAAHSASPLPAASCYFPGKRVRRLLGANSQPEAAREKCPSWVGAAG